MKSWWDLGETAGFRGDRLATHRIACPFCTESGRFSVEHEAVKNEPRGRKELHFTTLKCASCAGYVMVLWSAATSGGLHDFHVFPRPLRRDEAPDHWPKEVGNFWLQAERSLVDRNWDAAVVMARSGLQVALRLQGAAGQSLKAEIDKLADAGALPALMREWAHELRVLGNDAAHPAPGQAPTSSKDAEDVVQFLTYLLEYLYTLPHRIEQYRKRRTQEQ